MKIKQQKQIKGYLVREFGEEKGTALLRTTLRNTLL